MSDRHTAPAQGATNVNGGNTSEAGDNGGQIDQDDVRGAPEGGEQPDTDDQIDDAGDEGIDDAGSETDGEADDGTDVDEGGDLDGGLAPQRGRKESAVARLRARTQAAERAAQEATRRLDQLQHGQNTAEIQRRQEEYRAWVATLTPEERAEERSKQLERRLTGELRRTQFALGDQADRNEFQAKAQTSQAHAKYADRVEEFLASERRQGRDVKRETVLAYLIGLDALKKVTTTGTRRQNRAQAAIARETTRPTSTRGDAPAGGGRGRDGNTKAAREARLRNVQI